MIKVKNLSVNECWQGRRFKTPKYKSYENEVYYLLPRVTVPQGELELHYTFYVSNKLSDIDNFLKPLTDILQKKYEFNDNRIHKLIAEKKMVKKGEEGFEFSLTAYR